MTKFVVGGGKNGEVRDFTYDVSILCVILYTVILTYILNFFFIKDLFGMNKNVITKSK